MPRVVSVVLLAVLSAVGCGGGGNTGAATSPESLVTAFLSQTGDSDRLSRQAQRELHAGKQPKPLAGACELLSSDVRPAMHFTESGSGRDPVQCSGTLALALYYQGDTGEPKVVGYSGRVTAVQRNGDEALVTLRMHYRLSSGTRDQTTRVLAIRESSGWRLATPEFLNRLKSKDGPPTGAAVRARYRQLVAAAKGR